MKKKSILLVTLFCATLVMAIFGLGTENAYANPWDPDLPGWGESETDTGSKGIATTTEYTCSITEIQCTGCQVCEVALTCPPKYDIDKRDGTHCAMVSTNSCTPNNPCN